MLIPLLILSLCLAAHSQLSCDNLEPQPSDYLNYEAIMGCLSNGSVVLSGGIYVVSQGIAVPAFARLSGSGPLGSSTIQLNSSATNYVISPGSNSWIFNVIFDAAGNLPSGCCSAVVGIGAVSGVNVTQCQILGQSYPVATGIYFIDPSSFNNIFLQVNVSGMHYGVIFVAGLEPGSANRLEGCYLLDNHCDSVTFAGYGEIISSTIARNGWDCMNGNPPIPGGGPYCLGNQVGGVVKDSSVSDNCGMLLDIDSCSNFIITGNTFSQPGNTWSGAYPYCQGSLAVNLVDTSSFYFANNIVINSLDSNAVGLSYWGDPNHIFEDTGAAPFSDLPAGGNTVLGFTVTTRSSSISTTSNTIVNNTFLADCSTSGCAGVGYFAGRGTGWAGNGGAWSPNLYSGNDPYGSDIGSHRCGGNWYAGNTPSCPEGAEYPCNQDDFQHPDTSNWRNDPGCATYSP